MIIKPHESISPMKTINIFLASSGELKEDRNAIDQLIAKFNIKCVNQGLFLNLIRWENERQTIGKNRVQDHFNHLMLHCELVIVLFYKKIGEFTLEEYNLAYDQCKMGNKPHQILVCFKNTNVNIDSIKSDDILKREAIQTRITDDEQMFLTYDSIDSLINQLNQQLDKIIPSYMPTQNKSSTLNTPKLKDALFDKHLYCNRDDQVITFGKTIETLYNKNPGKPQFFVIHGHEDQCHESLVKRLHLKARQISQLNKWDHDLYPEPVNASWSFSGSHMARQESLRDKICQWFIDKQMLPHHVDTNEKQSMVSLCNKLILPSKKQTLFVRHPIQTTAWDKGHIPLIKWVMHYFWTAHVLPHQFIVFFEIRYADFLPQLMTGYPKCWIKWRLSKALKPEQSHCHILQELSKIRTEHIMGWMFDKLGIDDQAQTSILKSHLCMIHAKHKHQKKKIHDIQDPNYKLKPTCYYMKTIEPMLLAISQTYYDKPQRDRLL